MAANMQISSRVSVIFLFIQFFYTANSESSSLGVYYGREVDDLPSLESTVKLLKSLTFEKVRILDADHAVIKAFANTGIGLVISARNGDIPTLASPNGATQWVHENVLPFYPATNIVMISVGSDVLTTGNKTTTSQLVPAMQNLMDALNAASLGGKVKVSTVHSVGVLSKSDPPSAGAFDHKNAETTKALLQFLSSNKSPFMVNAYPFFVYREEQTEDALKYCLFQANRPDPVNGLKYTSMFDAQVDAVWSALNAMGFKDIEIVVAETGWPHEGESNEPGATLDNAKAYVGNLIKRLKSKAGTPLMPGKTIETFLFSLYDEDQKSGRISEKSYGLFKLDGSMNYDVDLIKKKKKKKAPSNPATPSTPKAGAKAGNWCVPKPGIPDALLQENIDYACSQGIDCSPIKEGGACFEPNNVRSHAAYAMNLYYQSKGKNPWNCDFSIKTGTLTNSDPSHNDCNYRGN